MTRASLRARLLTLEAKRDAVAPEPVRIWWADVGAGLWRLGTGPEEEGGLGTGTDTRPMTPEEVEEAQAEGLHLIQLTGLPDRGQQ